MRKKLPGASSLQTFSFLSAIPFKHGFSRQIEVYKVLKAFPFVAGRAFPAQNIDNSPPLCARRKISFSQTIFRSAEKKSFLSGKNSQILHIIRIFIQNEHLTGPFFRFIHRLKTIIRLRFV